MARPKSTAPSGAPSPSSLAPLLTRIMELQATPDPTDAEQAELARLETEWSNHWLADPHDIPSRSADAQSNLMDAVEDQRAQLRSVLGSVRCLETALQAQNPPDSDELEGALALVREELRSVIDALDEVNLLRANRSTPAGTGDAPAVRLPDRVDVLLTACSKADKQAVIELIRKAASTTPDECIEGIVDSVVRSPPVAASCLPIEAAKTLVRDLDAIGVDACIELTAASLGEQLEGSTLPKGVRSDTAIAASVPT